jgi:tetratricopeptide (TPR) repeat protein
MNTKTLTVALLLLAFGALPALSHDTKGIALYKEGKYTEAAGALKAELEQAPGDEQALTYLGLARVYAGDTAGAIDPLKQALAKNDNNAQAHFGLGLVSFKLKKLDDAVVELEKAWKLNPDDAYTHFYLATAYNEKGESHLAIPHLRRFVELAPDAPEAPAVRSFLSRL